MNKLTDNIDKARAASRERLETAKEKASETSAMAREKMSESKARAAALLGDGRESMAAPAPHDGQVRPLTSRADTRVHLHARSYADTFLSASRAHAMPSVLRYSRPRASTPSLTEDGNR